jgi:benzoyl-CoA reductase/2-hydroxyglutaryl-CoA dehydratase subunit BcrC/BadD/HgdB
MMTREFGSDAVGITSTIPIEVVFAAGLRPVDLNNRFVTDPDRAGLVAAAEAAGFPLNSCAWIKGIYGLAREGGVRRIIGVLQGDCSNTHVLLEILEDEGAEIIPFEYPLDRDAAKLRRSIEELADRLGTTLAEAEKMHERMRPLREKLERLDRLTWLDMKVSGLENHLWLINSSDMRGDWRLFERELDEFLVAVESRRSKTATYRLAFAGIPPIVDDLYERLEERGAAVVFNELQRQFSMPGPHGTLVEQYLAYTYPYRTSLRVADIIREVKARRIDGILHYIQSFCFRQLQDRAVRRASEVPVLALEFDRPGAADGRSLTRIEAFLEVLEGRRGRRSPGQGGV